MNLRCVTDHSPDPFVCLFFPSFLFVFLFPFSIYLFFRFIPQIEYRKKLRERARSLADGTIVCSLLETENGSVRRTQRSMKRASISQQLGQARKRSRVKYPRREPIITSRWSLFTIEGKTGRRRQLPTITRQYQIANSIIARRVDKVVRSSFRLIHYRF